MHFFSGFIYSPEKWLRRQTRPQGPCCVAQDVAFMEILGQMACVQFATKNIFNGSRIVAEWAPWVSFCQEKNTWRSGGKNSRTKYVSQSWEPILESEGRNFLNLTKGNSKTLGKIQFCKLVLSTLQGAGDKRQNPCPQGSYLEERGGKAARWCSFLFLYLRIYSMLQECFGCVILILYFVWAIILEISRRFCQHSKGDWKINIPKGFMCVCLLIWKCLSGYL